MYTTWSGETPPPVPFVGGPWDGTNSNSHEFALRGTGIETPQLRGGRYVTHRIEGTQLYEFVWRPTRRFTVLHLNTLAASAVLYMAGVLATLGGWGLAVAGVLAALCGYILLGIADRAAKKEG